MRYCLAALLILVTPIVCPESSTSLEEKLQLLEKTIEQLGTLLDEQAIELTDTLNELDELKTESSTLKEELKESKEEIERLKVSLEKQSDYWQKLVQNAMDQIEYLIEKVASLEKKLRAYRIGLGISGGANVLQLGYGSILSALHFSSH